MQKTITRLIKNTCTFLFFIRLITACDHKAVISHDDIKEKSTKKSYSVEDYEGNTVTLKRTAKRIIALAPHIVENLFSLELGNHVVGVVSHSNYPNKAKSIPVIGQYNAYNIERIISLKPDLIIAWSSGISPQFIQTIRSLNIPLYIDNPKSLEDIGRSLFDISQLAGSNKNGRILKENINQKIDSLSKKYSKQKEISIFVPLDSKPLRTLGGRHIVSDILNICGARNVFNDLSEAAPVISMESVLVRGADAILVGSKNVQEANHQIAKLNLPEKNPEKNIEKIITPNQRLNRNISEPTPLVIVNPDILYRHTMRLVDETEKICKKIDGIRSTYLERH